MKTYIITLIGLVCGSIAFGQTGYYGFLNGLEVSYSAAPSLRYKNKMKVIDKDTLMRQSRRMVNSSFHINYNRVIHNKLSLGLGYTYSNIRTIADRVNSQNTASNVLIEDVRTPYHGMVFKLKYFRFGNVNPVGKFIGFSLEYGQTELAVPTYNGATDYNLEAVGRFTTDYKLTNYQTFEDSLVITPMKNVFAKVNFGRNVPLTKSIFMSVEGSFNLVGVSFFSNGGRNFSTIGDLFDTYSFHWNSTSNNLRLLSNSVFAYKRLMLNVGIHYAF